MSTIWVNPVKPEDREFFDACLAKDEIHQKLGIQFSHLSEENTDSYVVSDEVGPLMTLRLHNALRVAIQFNPDTPLRSARAAQKVVDWFTGIARGRKAKEVIIRPGGGAIRFSEQLGFLPFDGKFIEVK